MLWAASTLVVLTFWTSPTALAQQTIQLSSGDSLSLLAQRTYGSPLEWPVIVSATNARLGEDSRLDYIGNPNMVQPGQWVYLPDEQEATTLWTLIRDYNRAVVNMSLAEPYEAVDSLLSLGDSPIVVVTWARVPMELGSQQTNSDIWVTVAPHLQQFCNALEPEVDLDLRLAQRLGMPPQPNKTAFVEIRIDDPHGQLFRPCANSSIDTNSCAPGPPASSDPRADWFYRQYFGAYGTALPDRYPWTSLGYTYDWGSADSPVGESEFVIPAKTQFVVERVIPTAEYCGRG